MTWDHERGLAPLVACAEELEREHGIRVEWEARPLQGFADWPLSELVRTHDLVVFDHPHLGEALARRSLLPLDELMDADTLHDMANNSVGPSHASYVMDDRTWAAPIDAAGTVAAWRPDLLGDTSPPRTWDEVFDLADHLARSGRTLAVPLVPIDVLTAFYTIVVSGHHDLFPSRTTVVDRATGRAALELLRRLVEVADPMSLSANPIQVLDAMAGGDRVAYSPLLFGYTNYGRPDFRPHLLDVGAFPSADGLGHGGVLGGAGLGISRHTRHPDVAAHVVAHIAAPTVQAGTYVANGGQPGDRRAWTDPSANALTNSFFMHTLDCMDHQYLRPRYDGYLAVQHQGGEVLHAALTGEITIDASLDRLEDIHRRAAPGRTAPA